ncbi:hypothetical protein QPK87_11425 [Kamptonema cortianum]|nr:hypothetical protein [Kamptonema cortianum]
MQIFELRKNDAGVCRPTHIACGQHDKPDERHQKDGQNDGDDHLLAHDRKQPNEPHSGIKDYSIFLNLPCPQAGRGAI